MKDQIVEYLQAGSKDGDLGRVGIIIDHIIVDEDGDAVPWEGYNGRKGIRDCMAYLAEFFDHIAVLEDESIVGCGRATTVIVAGPGGQIAVKLGSQLSVGQLRAEYNNFRFRLDQIVKEAGYSVEMVGYHPSAVAADLDLVPNLAYGQSEDYLRGIGYETPERITRGRGGFNVSIDYADEADAVRKMRIASLLAPILGLVADNTPAVDGEAFMGSLCGMQLQRAADPRRAGVVPGLFEEGFGFDAYAQWVVDTGVIAPLPEAIEADEAVHVMLGDMWTDVKLDQEIWITVADPMPIGAALSYVALVKGLFYSPINLELLEHFLGITGGVSKYGEQDIEDAVAAISKDGYEAKVYGREAAEWIDLLLRMAPEGLGTEANLLEEIKEYRGL